MAIADASQTGVAPASGRIELRFTPNARQSWVVQQVSVNGAMLNAIAVGVSAECTVFLDTAFIAVLAMPRDVGAGQPYVTVNNGRTFRVVITGAVTGSAVQATILYDDGENPSG